jgi:hypothetical protein
MPGYFPGIPGFVAFAGVKFGGYCLAGMALRKLQPAVTAGAIKVAATRTGLGILIGPPLTIAMAFALTHFFPESRSSLPMIGTFAFIYVLRVFIWALVIHLFTRQINLLATTLWMYAALGAVWSYLLDLPGIGLALISPGQIPIC